MEDVPSELRIGFVFPTFSSADGIFAPNRNGVQLLATFLMAVREINDKTDGIADDLLPNSQLIFAGRNGGGMYHIALLGAIDLAQTVFGGRGVQGVVGPLVTEAVLAAQQVLGNSDVLQIGSSNANDLNHHETGRTYLTTRAIDAFQAEALALLISRSWLHLSRVVVLHSSDAIGDGCFEAFATVAEELGIKIVAESSFSSLTTDFSSVISKVSVYRPRVIVLFSGSSTSAARLLEQGFNSGLISSDVTVLANSIVSSITTTNLFVNKNNTAAIMKGFLGLATYEDYWRETDIGKSFVDRFRAQQTKASIDPATGATICDESTDSDGGFYLYRDYTLYNASLPKVCAFVNFSTILPDGSNLIPFAPHVYDAVYALARGLHHQYYELPPSNRTLKGFDFKQAMIANMRFEGVTGLISFAPPSDDNELPGGSRRTSVKYKVINFQTATSSFGRIGVLDMDTKVYTPCTPSSSCFLPEFNSIGNAWPTDEPPSVILVMDSALTTTLYTGFCVVILMSIIATTIVITYRKTKVLKATQNVLSYAFVFGSLVGSGRVIVGTFVVSPTICALESVLGHVSFFACISTIIVKKMRLDLIINSAGFQKVKSIETDGLKRIAVVLAILALYLAVEGGLGVFAVDEEIVEDVVGRKSISYQCKYALIEFEYALSALEGVFLLYALHLCWLTRGVPDFLNDKHRSTGVVVLTMILGAAVLTLTVFLQWLHPEVGRFLSAFTFATTLCIALAALFGPPLYQLLSDFQTAPSEDPASQGSQNDKVINPEGINLLTSQNIIDLKDKSFDEQYKTCLNQQKQWKSKLTEMAAGGISRKPRERGITSFVRRKVGRSSNINKKSEVKSNN